MIIGKPAPPWAEALVGKVVYLKIRRYWHIIQIFYVDEVNGKVRWFGDDKETIDQTYRGEDVEPGMACEYINRDEYIEVGYIVDIG